MKSIVSKGVTFRVGDTVKSCYTGRTYQIKEINKTHFFLGRKGHKGYDLWAAILWDGRWTSRGKVKNRFKIVGSSKRKIKKTNWV